MVLLGSGRCCIEADDGPTIHFPSLALCSTTSRCGVLKPKPVTSNSGSVRLRLWLSACWTHRDRPTGTITVRSLFYRLSSIADAGSGSIAAVVTSKGTFGKARTDELSRRDNVFASEFHKWRDLAKSYSADSKTFVQQMTSALADVQLPDETQDNFVAVKLLKGNLTNLLQQTEKDPREMVLWYLNHMTGVFDGCVSAVRIGSAQ